MHDRRPNLSIIILFKLKCTAGKRGRVYYLRTNRTLEFSEKLYGQGKCRTLQVKYKFLLCDTSLRLNGKNC